MDYYADIGVQILFLIILGVSLNLLLGYVGQVSMAHATFYGIGAYTAGLLTLPVGQGITSRGVQSGLGWSIYPALVVATIVAFVFALLVSIPAASRVRGEYLILLTLAFQIVVNQLENSLEYVTGGPYGLTPIPPISLFGHTLSAPHQAFWPILVVTALVVFVAWILGESPFGRLLKGIREHEIAVRSVGKNTLAPKILIFSVAAGMAGFAGAIAAYYFQFIAPGTYSLDLSIFVVAIVVLGGAGNLSGTIIGAIVLGSLKPLLQQVVGDDAIPWQAVIYGAALVVLMRIRPQGLVPEGSGVAPTVRGLWRRLSIAPQEPVPAYGRLSVVEGIPEAHRTERGGIEPVPLRPAVVEVRGLAKRFDGLRAVDGVDFVLRQNVITALIGPNGAGKTTIFNLLTGLLKPDSGRVLHRGEDVTGRPPHEIAKKGMARSFQDVRVFQQLSAWENVAIAVPAQPGEGVFQLGVHPLRSWRSEKETRAKALEALAFVGLRQRNDEIAGSMSFGDQKLVAIARLLATECDVLLLDEPTSGVDPAAVEHVIEVILRLRALGRTICLVEHSVHFVEQLADHAIFLDQGKVVAEGTLEELTNQQRLVEIYFGT